MFAGEAAAASARGLSARVLQTDPLVIAIAETHVRAHDPGAVVSGLALAFKVACLRYEQTICVRVAVHLLTTGLARVRALRFARLLANT